MSRPATDLDSVQFIRAMATGMWHGWRMETDGVPEQYGSDALGRAAAQVNMTLLAGRDSEAGVGGLGDVLAVMPHPATPKSLPV